MTAPTDLAAVMTDLARARGLANAHYTDAATFDEEKHAVLFANWAAVGFGKDIPTAGSAKPVTFLGMPLLLVRDKDDAIHVYQNTCRHRGMILVETPQTLRGAIRCPYHSWCYTLQGKLRTTPHVGGPGRNMHPEVNRDELGLLRVRAHVWMDVIFVNIDGTAPDFAVAHADLLSRWADFDTPLFHGGPSASSTLTVKTNWKLAVENYCESYHLPWIHPGLNSYSRLEDHYHIENPGRFSGQGTRVYRQFRAPDGTVFPDFDGVGAKWNETAEYIAVYPNLLLGVHRDHVFAMLLEPVAVDTTVEHVEIYYATPPRPDDGMENMRRANTDLWMGVFAEDIFVVEGMQRGRYGPMFDGGKFSPAMDGPTHLFHHWVAQQIDKARTP